MLKLGHHVAIATLAAAIAVPGIAWCQDDKPAEPAAPAPAASKVANPAFLAGRELARQRLRECAAEWKTAKADAAVKAAGWPKFLSGCNDRLKRLAAAAGAGK